MDLSEATRLSRPKPPEPAASLPAPAGSGWLLGLQALALKGADPELAALAVLSEVARELQCDRASLGWLSRRRVRLAASTAGDARVRKDLARHLEAAMSEALEERSLVTLPSVGGTRDLLVVAHQALARHNGGLAIATVPVVGSERVLGTLVLERAAPFDAPTLRRAQDAALFVAPLLELRHRLHGPWPTRVARALAPRGGALHARRRGAGRLWWLLLPPLVAAALLWPVQQEVVAAARVEGGDQRVIAAPFDGYIAGAGVRAGAQVRAGDVLVALQDQDLQLQRQRWQAELAQLDKQYREALTQQEPAPIAIALAKLEQVQAQLALAEAELQRTQVRAPFDGIVISGDLHQSAGLPVQRGQTLLTLAPSLRLKVVAEVDEQDVARVQPGQAARVLFAGQGLAPLAFRVERVSPVARTAEGRNVFEIEGLLPAAQAPGAAVRPGQQGVARIDIGPARTATVAWDALRAWLRRLSWRFVG